jgi:DNA-directed RNA polymerase subunit E'
MYKILTIADKVRVPPSLFGQPFQDALKASLEYKWESIVDNSIGVVLSILGVGEVGEGKILPGDGALHYPVVFDAIVYVPENGEVVKGTVIDVAEFGVFIRFGPIDGMVHVSQIMDDFVSFDEKNNVFIGRESKRLLKQGDDVTARIISVSYQGGQYKIGLTMRQFGLGSLQWVDSEKKRRKERMEKPLKEQAGKKKGAEKEEVMEE